jgi:hypothetical protein
VISIWPIAHFFWGYSIFLPIVLFIFYLINKKKKLKDTGEFLKKRVIFGLFGGLWAMVPDIDYFLEENIFSANPISDIFFFHISADKVLRETDLFFTAEMLLIFAVINLLALVATVETFKRLNEVMFGKKPDEDDKDDDFLDEEGDDENDNDDNDEVEDEPEVVDREGEKNKTKFNDLR